MGYAWAPQVTGLVRGEPKPGQRHRSNGLAILMEFCEERASKSPTLDRSRSGGNTYWHRDGGPSGTATWDAMCAEAAEYRSQVKLKNGKTAERGLRGDAVIGWAAIMKPPPEMVAELGMTGKDVKRFCVDGFHALGQIEPRLFRQENVEAIGGHADEDGLHYHFAGKSKDKAGKYCGNLIDANLCVRINEQFPALMRGMGWPIDDLDMTDWERMKTDPAYRAEREAKRKRQGQSVEQYGKQRAEAAGRVAVQIITEAKAEAQVIRDNAVKDAKEDAKTIRASVTGEATKELEHLTGAILTAQRELGDLTEFRAWRRDKAAQEAQEAAKKEQEAQEARKRQEAAREAEKAKERERQAQEARRAAQAKPVAARHKTREEMYQEAMAAIHGGGTVPQAAPERPKRQESALGALARLRQKTEAAARDAEKDGPDYPGS